MAQLLTPDEMNFDGLAALPAGRWVQWVNTAPLTLDATFSKAGGKSLRSIVASGVNGGFELLVTPPPGGWATVPEGSLLRFDVHAAVERAGQTGTLQVLAVLHQSAQVNGAAVTHTTSVRTDLLARTWGKLTVAATKRPGMDALTVFVRTTAALAGDSYWIDSASLDDGVLPAPTSSVHGPIYDRLNADATLTGLLATYGGTPAIFTAPPIPENAALPVVVVEAPEQESADDTKTTLGRSHTRSVSVYTNASGDVDLAERIAARIVALFHRQPLGPAGSAPWRTQAFGPYDIPTDGTVYGRRIMLEMSW